VTTVNGSAPQAPARRTSLLADGALAAGLAVVLTVGTYFAAQHQPDVTVLQGQLQRLGHRPFDAGAVALVAASAGALAMRRRYPVAVLALVFGTTLVYFVLGYANGPIWLALVIAYYTATSRGHRLAAGDRGGGWVRHLPLAGLPAPGPAGTIGDRAGRPGRLAAGGAGRR